MKIKDVKTHHLVTDLNRPFYFSQWWYSRREACLVEITTEDGITGWGECYGPARPIQTIIEEAFKQYLVGEEPRDIDRHWEYLYNRYRDYGQKGLVIEAISGVDIALWDIFGKDTDLPGVQASPQHAHRGRRVRVHPLRLQGHHRAQGRRHPSARHLLSRGSF